ncbi:U-box domain-containing protein 3 [Apostasia shenzhenica]|uniref:U-box domain-containing protein 3 n=1 Tax=Apostasia shenzhenica TaxID=1088818 RepID=A0A2I0AT12_9ASPA|nr:U-box domain-containing protein 3 [Apostasia shenzhenica]
MCQNPNLCFAMSPSDPPSPSGPEEAERNAKRQGQLQEFAGALANGGAADRVQAAREIRKFARRSPRARSALAVPAIIQPLIAMLSSVDHSSRESALLALLNIALRNERNKEKIVSNGVVPLLVDILRSDSSLRELATAAILTLSSLNSNKPIIAASGAVHLLVKILVSGSMQGRVDAVTALYNLSNCKEISEDIHLSIEAVRPLLTLLRDSKKYSKFADKAAGLLGILSKSEEGRCAISEVRGGILTLVETVEEGSLLSTEHAVSILLSLCRSNREKYRKLILNEGPIPGLLILTVEGTKKANDLARDLLELLRDDSRHKKVASEDLETIVYSIATRVDGPDKAEETAKKLLQDMLRRNMEADINRLQLT